MTDQRNGAPENDERPPKGPNNVASGHHTTLDEHKDTALSRHSASQQVSWFDVHEHVAPILGKAGSWPMIGSPGWCELSDDDVRKLAAIYDAAQHWALRVETSQQAECEASQDISAAADWTAIANGLMAQRQWYAEHPWGARWSA